MDEVRELKDNMENLENNVEVEEVTSLVEKKENISDEKSNNEKNKEDKAEKPEKLIEFKLDNLNLSKTLVLNILEDLRVIKKRFNHIENIIKEAERAQYGPSRDIPGVNGIYDGEFLVTSDGIKHEVPKNYAAKSLLVNGDELKMMEQDGKVAFKIVTKVPRKKIEGLLSKKDGRYVILSDSGTFNLQKNAVEFRNIKQGEWVLAVIPETGSANNFAAVDKIIKKEVKKEVKFFDKPKRTENQSPNKPVHDSRPKETKSFEPKPEIKYDLPKKEEPKKDEPKTNPMPKIQFSDDDLV